MVIESGQWLPVPPGIYYSLLCKYRWAMNRNTGFNHTITQEKSKFDSGLATWVHMSSNKYMWSITSGKGIKQYFYAQSLKTLSSGLKRARWSFSFLVEKVKPTQNQTKEKSTFLVTEWVCLDRNTGSHLFQPPCSSRVPRTCYLGLCWRWYLHLLHSQKWWAHTAKAERGVRSSLPMLQGTQGPRSLALTHTITKSWKHGMIWMKRKLKDHLIASPLTWDPSAREGCTKPRPSWQWMVFGSRHGEL